MHTNETETDGEAPAADDIDEGPGPSVLEGAITGVAGMVMGSAIIYFALPYCFNC